MQAQRLLALGWWLRTNGDAIYGTRPWTRTDGTTGEGHDIRYTTRDGAVFAIVCGTPGRRRAWSSTSRRRRAPTVHLLGHDAPLAWTAVGDGCAVTLPGRPAEAPAFALRLSAVRARQAPPIAFSASVALARRIVLNGLSVLRIGRGGTGVGTARAPGCGRRR